MPPSFMQILKQRGMPPEPPRENPNEVAVQSWERLHEYATKALAIAQEVDDTNKTMAAENEVLRIENDRKADRIAELERENRMVSAFAESMRTRVRSLREQAEIAEHESLKFAQAQVSERPRGSSGEMAELERVAGNIARINPREGEESHPMPQVSWATRS